MKLWSWLAPLVAVASLHAQNTWYVDANGSHPGAGTENNPFQSIDYAIHAPTTADHDVILVRPGAYVGQVRLDRPIIVRSTDGPIVTQIRGGGLLVDIGLFLTGTLQNVRLEGFTIQRTGTNAGNVVRMTNGTLDRCIVIGNGVADGVYFLDLGKLDHSLVTGCHRGVTEIPLYNGGALVENSILWGNNVDSAIAQGMVWYSSVGTVTALSGLGGGVLRVPPRCFDLAGHDFHLMASSSCIDAGHPNAIADPDGSPSDIGPFAFDASYQPFEIYCTAKINSLGCVPSMGVMGTASASSNLPFSLTCEQQLNQKLGLVFYGFAPKNAPYQGGFLCVRTPVKRSTLLNSGGANSGEDCSGVFTYDFNARIASGVDALLVPGVEVFAQFWSRDPNASFSTNRSNAVRFSIQP